MFLEWSLIDFAGFAASQNPVPAIHTQGVANNVAAWILPRDNFDAQVNYCGNDSTRIWIMND
jgi:hypothetical protein